MSKFLLKIGGQRALGVRGLALVCGGVFSILLSSYTVAQSIRTVVLSGQQMRGADSGLLFGGFEEFGNHIKVAVINNDGQVSFKGMLQVGSGGVSPETQHGIFQEQDDAIQTIVRSHNLAPGTTSPHNKFRTSFVQFSPFADFSVNESGEIVFLADLAEQGVIESLGENAGIWSTAGGTLELVALTGAKPPNTSPETTAFLSLRAPSISRTGKTSFAASLQRVLPLSSRAEASVWSEDSGTLQVVARQGELAPEPSNDFDFTSPLNGISDRGDLGGLGGLKAILRNRDHNFNLDSRWRVENGTPHLIAHDGSLVSEIEAGATLEFGSSHDMTVNDAGQATLRSYIFSPSDTMGRESVLFHENDTFSLLAQSGSHAPGTPDEAVFRFFGTPVINSAGNVAFTAHLIRNVGGVVGNVNEEGLWSDASGSLRLVARQGSQAPGAPLGAVFEDILLSDFNDTGQVLFEGFLKTGIAGVTSTTDRGIWAEDSTGTLRLIIREGDELEVATNDFRTVSEFNFRGKIGGIGGFNDIGQIVFTAGFTDGSSGVFVSNLIAVPEPSSAILFGVGILLLGSRRIFHPVREPMGGKHDSNVQTR